MTKKTNDQTKSNIFLSSPNTEYLVIKTRDCRLSYRCWWKGWRCFHDFTSGYPYSSPCFPPFFPMASFLYPYCWLLIYFTRCSSVSIVNFEQVVSSWIFTWILVQLYNTLFLDSKKTSSSCKLRSMDVPRQNLESYR